MNYVNKHPVIMVIIGICGISMSPILVRLSNAPSAVTAAYRLCWTVLLMSPLMLGSGKQREELKAVDRKTMLLSAASGLFLAVHFYLWFESLRHTTVASATTIVCTEVIWVALGYVFFMGGKLSRREILGIAITLAGSVLLAAADSTGGGERHLLGDVLSLFAAIACAIYMLIGRKVRADSDVSTGVYSYIVYIACAVVLVAIVLIGRSDVTAYGLRAPLVGLLLAIFPTILGHTVFNWCLKYYSPAFISVVKLCEPVIASVGAVILFAEIPGVLQLVGGVVIIGGVIYYSGASGVRGSDQ